MAPVKVINGHWGAVTVYSGDKLHDPITKPIIGTGTPISERIKLLERDERKKVALARARARLGGVILNEGVTFSSLRLSRGLSQAALAEAIGSKQSYIARIENHRTDLRNSTVDKIADILGVDGATLRAALETGWKLSEAKGA